MALCLLTATTSSAQDHLRFCDIPIDGTCRGYVDALKGAGFTYFGNNNGTELLTGDIVTVRGCTVAVSSTRPLDLVCGVTVSTPVRKEWCDIQMDYDNIKAVLTRKYGKPTECHENTSTNDVEKMQQICCGNFTHYATFNTSAGIIDLAVRYNPYCGAYVRLTYSDKTNLEKIYAASMKRL